MKLCNYGMGLNSKNLFEAGFLNHKQTDTTRKHGKKQVGYKGYSGMIHPNDRVEQNIYNDIVRERMGPMSQIRGWKGGNYHYRFVWREVAS